MSSKKIVLDISARIAYNNTVKAIAITWFAWPLRNGRRAVTSEGGKYTMSEVHVRENESLESALKRFKRSCAKSGVLAEVRKREYYDSPSVKRRKKSEAARKNKKKFY